MLVAIDPGEVYCGVAMWFDGKWISSDTMPPDVLMPRLETTLESHTEVVVVVEEWRPYPWAMAGQAFKKAGTAEVVGMVKWACARAGVDVVEQRAESKKVARGMMRSRGMKEGGKTRHARDAEALGWYYLWKEVERG